MDNISVIPLILCVTFICIFFTRYMRVDKTPLRLESTPVRLGFPTHWFPMEKKDLLPMAIITVVYAVVAFWGLGDTAAPQSFCLFEDRGRYIDIELREPQRITKVMYYTGLHHGDYFLQFSDDGENYIDQKSMPQSYGDLFKWMTAELEPSFLPVRYVRIIAGKDLELGELVIFGALERKLAPEELIFDEGAATVFDEQELLPEFQYYLNSAYFDEIYHARTAYENVRNVYPYEISHPPLGKLLISIGIHIFGMTPFGWRFIGTLFGVLMLPFLYVFIKNLFGKSLIASCATILFAADFMHYTQTRIATIDTYGVFFMILMYLFLYRFLCVDLDSPELRRRDILLPLFFSGLCFGLGAASKWTCVYSGAGLGLLWLMFWGYRTRELARVGRLKSLVSELLPNIAWCVLFFVIIPLTVYYLSYYPYGRAIGLEGFGMFFKREYFDEVIRNQTFMFTYHRDVVAEHPYASRWYQWILDLRPILYFVRSGMGPSGDLKSAFAAFTNPLVCWAGLCAIVSMCALIITQRDGRALFIVISYLAQLLPWMIINRLTFAYHYFPCMVFLVMALGHVFSALERDGGKRYVYAFTGVAVLLFIMFYPAISGVPAPEWYSNRIMRWIRVSWPI